MHLSENGTEAEAGRKKEVQDRTARTKRSFISAVVNMVLLKDKGGSPRSSLTDVRFSASM